ncbi:hypothetical protein NMG60_11003100 [Bertholletia excelsa]
MEDSSGSSVNKGFVSEGRPDAADEESGWTSYFEDFWAKQREEQSCSSDSFCSPSLLSDAASSAAWKINNSCSQVPDGSPMMTPKKLNFKKTRTREISRDDSLEDTASSPVNSPKIGSMKEVGVKPRKRDDYTESSQQRKGGGTKFYSEFQADERNGMNFNGNIISSEYTELKQKGLCLVPLSMFVNYLG